jgi:NADPH:quinone reductase-like Zn-dependent oxidoreductase
METMTAITSNPDGEMRVETIERPQPGPTEVLVKVAAAGVNPVDWKVGADAIGSGFFAQGETIVLGWDIAGEVVEAGAGVTRFSVGDRVFGMPRFPRPARAYAEYVVAGSREIAAIPESVSDLEAGATPLAALTAWQAIVDTLEVGSGDRVLIHAAAGGVGHIATQIAKSRGAEVWGTASAENHETIRRLGVDHAIDYKNERFEEVAQDMDAVLDLVGLGDNPERSLKSLRPGGRLIVIPAGRQVPSQDKLDEAGVEASWMLVEPDYASLEKIAAMMSGGSLKIIVGESRPLEQMAELHEIGKAGGPFGKLVATVG